MVEGRRPACLVVHDEPVARSAGGVTLALNPPPTLGCWRDRHGVSSRFIGVAAQGRIVRAQRQKGEPDGFVWSSTGEPAEVLGS
jgi:hypothetical protein